ncbi:uncharacterized protein BDZ83DRAFT_73248 [Colletotrichum acutatum]|uniref:Uncharacterized protein n=1 Tax=Glomerella acutata TaxID=27357 RepID=A0AAD8XCS4_GLOAC|nr:uncharacterized protein BDZ83DRAFT_73248 [Colletotrichum acutatum]KAK1714516.1 hypothetical protein BDZ83DRAFT_73248 [Colletotrichum acutatum]
MDYQPYITGSVLRSVLSGLVVLPALGFSVLVLRKPGARHDHTRRWVDFTKIALGLWSISELLSLIYWIVITVYYARRKNGYFSFPNELVNVYFVGGLIGYFGHVALLLAFFSLAHALTQLRSGAESDDSKAYRIGRKVVLGLSALVTLVAVAIFACQVAETILFEMLPGRDRYIPGDWDNAIRLGLAAQYMGVINLGFLLVAALGFIGYAVVSFKAARSSPTQTAATLLLIAASLWLITRLYSFISYIMAMTNHFWGYGSTYIGAAVVDMILYVWPSFAALIILYVLASDNTYSLSTLHLEEEDDAQRIWDERTQSI